MTRRPQSGRMALFAVLASAAFLACQSSLTEVTEQVGPSSFDFAVGPSVAGLPSGTVALGGSSVTLTLSGLRELASGEYEFWMIGRDPLNLDVPVQVFGTIRQFFLVASGTDPITGDTIFVTDSTDIATTRTAGYAGSDDALVTKVVVTLDSTADGSNPATYHAVVVTLEAAPASAPGPARFLWRRIGVGGAGSMLFGNYGGSDVVNVTSPRDYVFGARGAGLAGARGPEISVDMEELARPPVGFYYAGYIVKADGTGKLVDTLRSAWSQDPTISRVSMYDADVNDLLPDLVGGDIRHSQIRNCAAGSNQIACQNSMQLDQTDTFVGYESFQLKLEPKGGVAPIKNKSVTHAGALPKAVK